jgi:hypothetical protein
MFLFILGVIPYMLMAILMASMGYTAFNSWQVWAALGIMLASDLISYIKGRNSLFNS